MAIAVNDLQLAGFVNAAEVTTSADTKDVTTFGSAGHRQYVVGLASFMLKTSGFQDQIAPSPASAFNSSSIGTVDSFTVSIPGTAVADPAYIGTAVDTKISNPATVGEVAPFTIDWSGTGRIVRGQLLHPAAARTATGNGTATPFVTPTATQSLWASFHVHSVTGAGTITFTVQTDDNVAMTTPATRITSTAFGAIGGDVRSLAGALAAETHIRVVYTIVGFTSVTFTAAAGTA